MNREIKHFTDLEVWRRAHQLFLDLLNDIKEFPKNIVSQIIIGQMIRSVGSISANIAEGFNSRSTKQYINYLDISRRSTAETENWYYKVRDANYLSKNICLKRIKECIEISKMLYGLMNSLDKGRGAR
ncbi:MAG: four helix bundle protein [bacterium]